VWRLTSDSETMLVKTTQRWSSAPVLPSPASAGVAAPVDGHAKFAATPIGTVGCCGALPPAPPSPPLALALALASPASNAFRSAALAKLAQLTLSFLPSSSKPSIWATASCRSVGGSAGGTREGVAVAPEAAFNPTRPSPVPACAPHTE